MKRTIAVVVTLAVTLLTAPVALSAPSLLSDAPAPFSNPYGIAISPDDASVALIGNAADQVAYVSPATLLAGTPINVGTSPYWGVFDAAGSATFVANYDTDNVSVLVGGVVVTTLTVGSDPYRILRAGTGRIVTMNQGRGGNPGVSVIDPASRTTLRTVNTCLASCEQLSSIAATPASATVWVTAADYLKSAQIETGAIEDITPPLAGGQIPHAVEVSDDGSTLALITRVEDELILLDARTGAVRHRVSLGDTIPRAIVFSPDHATVYLLSEDDETLIVRVRAYDVASGDLRRTITLPNEEYLVDASPEEWFSILPDGSRVIFATQNTASTRVYFADVRTGGLAYVEIPSFDTHFGALALTHQGNRLYATNNRSTGRFAVIRTASAPATPTAVTARADDASAAITWSAPTDDGGAAIASYTATASPGGAACTATAAVLGCTIRGLTNGTGYSISVTATTLGGTSTASEAATATPRSAPGAPTTVTATPGLLRATVSWKAPTDTGGGITGYTATANPGGATCTTTGAVTCTITGLLNTKAYTITVAARSAGGTGTASSATTAVRPYKLLAMRKPSATATRIRAQVKTTGPSTITQLTTSATGATICRATATPKSKGTSTLTCTVNKATRTALKKKAATVTVLTTLRTKQGASFAATYRVTLPKSG
jgi:hypothetical protein